MRYPWIDEYLLSKWGVTRDLQPDWNWIRYHIGGKMFAAILLDPENRPYYINLKLEPLDGEFLRAQYPDIIPGYYSDKRNWNSVKADGQVPDQLLRALLDRSYALVLGGFSRQKRRELLGLSCCGTDCGACPLHGGACPGCNEAKGRVFHAPQGKACPIYACAVQTRRRTSCAGCGELPCGIWRETRDPALADEAFAENIQQRIQLLKERFPVK